MIYTLLTGYMFMVIGLIFSSCSYKYALTTNDLLMGIITVMLIGLSAIMFGMFHAIRELKK